MKSPGAGPQRPKNDPVDHFYTNLRLKDYQIWNGFFVLAKLNEGRRSSATLTGMKRCQSEKGPKDDEILA